MGQSIKAKVTFTINPNTKEEFNKLADKNALNRSKWIEKKMQEYIKENSK